MIQVQKWLFGRRHLIVDSKQRGSVMVETYKDEKVRENIDGADAFLCALWVDKKYRKQGVARSLMELAEAYAKLKGIKTLALEHDDREAPTWVRRWYERRGYDTKSFGRHNCLMIKDLTQCQSPTEKNTTTSEKTC